jgi:tetratricopeptide (TPR) repeat protein
MDFMQDDDIEFIDESKAEIDRLMREATRIVCGTRDFAAGLARFIDALPALAPQLALATAENDAESRRALCSVLFREIWNHVPRPDNGFRALPMPKQERNSPCQCGSGKKFKQCCGRFAGAAPFDAQGLSLLKYVLEDIPESDYATLPFRQLSAEELAFVADQWLQEGRPDKVSFLLVPLLADLHKLDARHEAAFDLLGDAYLHLGMPEEREALVERMMNASDATLKCAALHRRCTVLSDAGQWSEAWQVFAQAQRLQPDNPALSHLEVIMLTAEGKVERAQDRALFWLARLSRKGLIAEGDPLLDFLRAMSENPAAALSMMQGEPEDADDIFEAGYEWAFALIDLLEDLPEAEPHYALHPQNGNAGELEADQKLAVLEQEWEDVFPQAWQDLDDSSPWDDTDWLDWLAANPLAWQSFRIVDDVVAVIDNGEVDDDDLDGDLGEMEDGLLAHAAALLEKVIARNKAQGCRLEWGWLENRPALRLLSAHIDRLDEDSERLRLLELMVITLNPNDNQGLRENLARLLIANERADDALALCERYPDDGLGAMLYARVLALHRLDRLDEAAAALAVARKERPKILKTLISVRPRMPELDFDMVEIGGDDEAWYYRMDWLHLWQEHGALAWVKKAAKSGP